MDYGQSLEHTFHLCNASPRVGEEERRMVSTPSALQGGRSLSIYRCKRWTAKMAKGEVRAIIGSYE